MADDDKRGPGNPNWQVGMASPNPKGRIPNRKMYAETLREILESSTMEITLTIQNGEEVVTKKISVKANDNKNLYYGVAAAQIIKSMHGDVRAAKEIMDRVEGRIPLPLVDVPGGGPAERKYLKIKVGKDKDGNDKYRAVEF